MMSNRIWVLGSADPEMEAIEELLRECGETVAYAVTGLNRVHPAKAMHAESLRDPETDETVTLVNTTDWTPPRVYAVECDGHAVRKCVNCGGLPDPCHPGLVISDVGTDGGLGVCGDAHTFPVVVRIDHHRPGDPGFGRPPAEFMAASSLGQVIAELARLGALPAGWSESAGDLLQGDIVDGCVGLGLVLMRDVCAPEELTDACTGTDTCWGVARIPQRLLMTAAADHCLGAAYQGECPGVDHDALGRFRAEQRAMFQSRTEPGVTADVILERIAKTQAALSTAPVIALVELVADSAHVGTITIRDMRRAEPWPELPEAATRLGLGYISGPLESPDGRRKYTCSGSAEQVRAWLENWAPAHGIVYTYGDPSRGFAGGYGQ